MLEAKRSEIEASDFRLVRYPHGASMDMIRNTESGGKFVFFVRHPVSAFVSSFNSRLRMGAPAYHRPWTEAEEAAFRMFPEPEALAAALDSDDRATRTAAYRSMTSINHIKTPLKFWLGKVRRLRRRADEIFFIGAQETFDEDCTALFRKLAIDDALPQLTLQQKHAAPGQPTKELSQRAVRNLEEWYADDIAIYQWCMSNKLAINSSHVKTDMNRRTVGGSIVKSRPDKTARPPTLVGAAKAAAAAAGKDWTFLLWESRRSLGLRPRLNPGASAGAESGREK